MSAFAKKATSQVSEEGALPYALSSGHFTCYLGRTYHVLPTFSAAVVDRKFSSMLRSRRFVGPSLRTSEVNWSGDSLGERPGLMAGVLSDRVTVIRCCEQRTRGRSNTETRSFLSTDCTGHKSFCSDRSS